MVPDSIVKQFGAKLCPTKTKYIGHEIKLLGEAEVTIESGINTVKLSIIVAKTKAPPLLWE